MENTTLQDRVRHMIEEDFARLRAKSAGYSLRAFARRLQVSPAGLSQILSGKRNLTRKTAEKILKRLSIDPTYEHLVLLNALKCDETPPARGASSDPREPIRLQLDHFRVISDWYHFAILSLIETEDFIGDPGWISRRLGIRVPQTVAALERLEKLGMLRRDGSGQITATGEHYATISDISDLSIRRNHFQGLELARRSLEEDDVSVRDFSSITLTLDPDALPKAKKMLKAMRRQFSAKMESGKRKEVYRLSIQLIPLTRKESVQ